MGGRAWLLLPSNVPVVEIRTLIWGTDPGLVDADLVSGGRDVGVPCRLCDGGRRGEGSGRIFPIDIFLRKPQRRDFSSFTGGDGRSAYARLSGSGLGASGCLLGKVARLGMGGSAGTSSSSGVLSQKLLSIVILARAEFGDVEPEATPRLANRLGTTWLSRGRPEAAFSRLELEADVTYSDIAVR